MLISIPPVLLTPSVQLHGGAASEGARQRTRTVAVLLRFVAIS